MNLKNTLSYINKIISLILIWILISPLFFYFYKKWWPKKKLLRWFFLIISPFSAIMILLSIVGGVYANYWYDRTCYFDRKTLEKVTETQIPPFRVIDRTYGKAAFIGDYKDSKLIQFKKSLTSEFYDHLDSLCCVDQKHWRIKRVGSDTIYTFQHMWGNGIPGPHDMDDDDRFLNFEIKKGVNEAILEYGSW